MRHVHFIGIGGYSMSGLALLLHQQGIRVTGSDMNRSSRTERLEGMGITVFYGHTGDHLGNADVVVYTTDVPRDNPERARAEAEGRTLKHRSELLAELLGGYRSLLVAGTHGKTTTSTMIGRILTDTGRDPTVLVGGEVRAFGGNVRRGAGPLAVAEADESDGSFLRYRPWVAVATNVEPEHLEHYHGSLANLEAAFERFLAAVPSDGLAVLGYDSPALRAIGQRLGGRGVPICTYGLNPTAEVTARDVVLGSEGSRFTVQVDGRDAASVALPIPGRHNVVNALGAMAAARHAGIAWEAAAAVLARFENAARRFERVFDDGRVLVVDDYAHHPSEIQATLMAARQVTPGRVLAVFQPQRYTRTQQLWDRFVTAFDTADQVYLTEIYGPPGEHPIEGVSGERLAAAVRAAKGGSVHFVQEACRIPEILASVVRSGDTVITMGAGNIYRVAYALRDRFLAARSSG